MGLIQCKECGKSISEDAGACPQCGKPIERELPSEPEPQKKAPVVPILIVLILLGAGGYFLYARVLKKNMKDLKKKAEKITDELSGKEKKEPAVLCDETVEVNEDTYISRTVEIEDTSTVTVECNVTEGPVIDIVTLDADGFALWEAKKPAEATPVSKLSASGQKENLLLGTLPKGTFHVIVDNTNYGGAAPPTNMKTDKTTVTLKITVAEKEE